ncbi:zinc uptake protein ZrgA [Celeribacter sp.]|uniref:zinc uptake protein ZrgA n=1 Tax=Celeribacter sp. TaxID=1890673 RepID=UPI003A8DEC32
MKYSLSLFALVAALPAVAEETRHMDAHVHGVGSLDIAIDGTTVAMTLETPGADIVGFEYEAKADEDRAAIETALATLSAPLDLFGLPEAAGCSVVSAKAELESEAHDDHDHDEHAHDEDHDDHDDHDHDEHAHDEDHNDHDHDEHAHDEDHDDHDHGATHSAFHAEYELTCDAPEALTEINFAYFDRFENAQEVKVQMITGAGAQAFDVHRDAPVLKLEQ